MTEERGDEFVEVDCVVDAVVGPTPTAISSRNFKSLLALVVVPCLPWAAAWLAVPIISSIVVVDRMVLSIWFI
jgi:hypothetical protein